MATREEMIKWLKGNRPDICEYQKIDDLPTDNRDDDGFGKTNVLRLYIQYHGGADTWDTLTGSEQDNVFKVMSYINKFFHVKAIEQNSSGLFAFLPVFDVSSMKNGWIYADKAGKSLGISVGGVLSINGKSTNNNGDMMYDSETITQGLSENF